MTRPKLGWGPLSPRQVWPGATVGVAQNLPHHAVEGLAPLASADLTTEPMEVESIFRQVIYMLGLEGEKSDLFPEKKSGYGSQHFFRI